MMQSVPDEMIRTASDREAVRLGYYFDRPAAERVCSFFSQFLRHSKGPAGGKAFDLLPWQRDRIIFPLFGWRRPDGRRRFTKAGCAVAKKNGKSTLLAGLAAYAMVGDGEHGPEVYTAAADQKQAGIIYHETANMVEASKALSGYLAVKRGKYVIESPLNHGVYRALSAEARTKDGLNASWLFFDELHTQKTFDLWNTLKYAGVARSQPVMFWITTAGYDRASLCFEQWQHARAVQRSERVDLEFLPCIFEPEPDDDWTKEETWYKANPSLGETITIESFRSDFAEALRSPTSENTFKRLRLNIWTEQETRWLPVAAWDECESTFDPAALWGIPCRLGVDLAATTDLAAVSGLCRMEDNTLRTWQHFWASEGACKRREIENRVRLDWWAKEGLITICPGAVINYDSILEYVQWVADIMDVTELCIDPWNATQFATDAAAVGFNVELVRPTVYSISPACKEFEKLVLTGQLRHNGNKVMRWMFGNVAVEQDAQGNIRPTKKKSTEKIDGVVATLLALKREIETSTYEYSKYGATGLTTF